MSLSRWGSNVQRANDLVVWGQGTKDEAREGDKSSCPPKERLGRENGSGGGRRGES